MYLIYSILSELTTDSHAVGVGHVQNHRKSIFTKLTLSLKYSFRPSFFFIYCDDNSIDYGKVNSDRLKLFYLRENYTAFDGIIQISFVSLIAFWNMLCRQMQNRYHFTKFEH